MDENEYKEQLDALIKDEEEAIEGYDKVIEKLDDENIKAELKKIRDEEQAHLDFLKKAKEDKDAKYEDPSEPDNNDGEPKEREAASILFHIDLTTGGN